MRKILIALFLITFTLHACAEYIAAEIGLAAINSVVNVVESPPKKELKDESDEYVCRLATYYDGSKWNPGPNFKKFRDEVKRRGLNRGDCNTLTRRGLGLSEWANNPWIKDYKNDVLCIKYDENEKIFTKYAAQIRREYGERKLNYDECFKYINEAIRASSDEKVCAKALHVIYPKWSTDYAGKNYTREARKRGFDVESCWMKVRPNVKFTPFSNSQTEVLLTDLKDPKISEYSHKFVCERATKKDGLSFESLTSSFENYVIEAKRRGFNVASCNQFTGRGNSQNLTQTVQIPKTKVDKSPPNLEIQDRIIVDTSEYKIQGKVIDDSKVYIQVDGNTIFSDNGLFTITGYTPIGEQRLTIIAKDQWGNTNKKDIVVERVMSSTQNNNYFEKLNPNTISTKKNKNRIALVIGIEKYSNISDAKFAKNDALYFIDYANSALGVPQDNIKYFFDENAGFKLEIEIKRWLKKNIRGHTEVFIYFSGHGIAQKEGQELYLLTNNTESDFIRETAINRNEIFNNIAQYNPKSVNVFLDTCYSGAGRADGEILLAMAKGLVVVDEQQQQLPDNFTLFTAASAQESAWSLPEAQHGTFSYFLMKGMEGNADLNGDKKLTNGELRDYLLDNVGRYAQQQQTPQMVGDPNQVLIKF